MEKEIFDVSLGNDFCCVNKCTYRKSKTKHMELHQVNSCCINTQRGQREHAHAVANNHSTPGILAKILPSTKAIQLKDEQ